MQAAFPARNYKGIIFFQTESFSQMLAFSTRVKMPSMS